MFSPSGLAAAILMTLALYASDLSGARSAKAQNSGSPGVVVTREVWHAISQMRHQAEAGISAGISRDRTRPSLGNNNAAIRVPSSPEGGGTWSPNIGSPLPSPFSFPTLTVVVDPSQPTDFVVTINGTPYQSGACVFKIVAGPATIVVIRQGKPPCSTSLNVTNQGPNAVNCKL